MTEDSRLDSALAERGIARSRTHAARMIADGLVTVDGVPALKPSIRVRDDQDVAVAGLDHYVSRAAHKLLAALDTFATVRVAGRNALDVGASTGGFSQVLLERGAASVIALDVGHAQLAPRIRSDDRVHVVEGFNARDLTAARLAEAARTEIVPDLVVSDVSFISLRMVLPPVAASVDPLADFVVLVKPQFEVGRLGVREGIVRDPELRREALSDVLWSAWDLGLGVVGLAESPLPGGAGNREYLAHLHRDRGTIPTEWRDAVTALTTG
ncbi:TlyA family rRNA (cytidine-2'-O)-methyltransferase [Rathayibacter sp. AY1E9]|jgi:23S rRNA (cytidine1920-2'-O)/16S rRNA (cytidine1409-2'-O)-methyltransferase|uniref:TlyA family RNA methyltransferase n=1 Tax=unclassified Rathayibacter TaxID=2609250 RepID=UPI000CE91AED|nr:MULTISPECIES: TlyA family RNA methyltransferase [unclassified Rathayibacter]PPF50117.1 TlyA family rRNA (cytidine-2'-O)-methyltransferase [Rathayibacter sp. AY1A1]PPG37616.1 TlyA family rRNA (cytidine-2'-O)-methyltransferase [Rathayibacter sp. AY2B5]PPG53901.1 TlyA family rRNA (cytidine-2'-O)-methyltransferase [Rathayibacter sp. AY1E9]PPG59550.1 TlyA family rRNA (cytidine-2'-O)-methyltransferase [Rathayibacter sp. AY1C5]PPG83784.1 TlyA family rRNA (cytidine-2'-O)-methyltransferase [Rathayib